MALDTTLQRNSTLLTSTVPVTQQPFLTVAPTNISNDSHYSQENMPIIVWCRNGNPKNGVGSLDILVTYKIIPTS